MGLDEPVQIQLARSVGSRYSKSHGVIFLAATVFTWFLSIFYFQLWGGAWINFAIVPLVRRVFGGEVLIAAAAGSAAEASQISEATRHAGSILAGLLAQWALRGLSGPGVLRALVASVCMCTAVAAAAMKIEQPVVAATSHFLSFTAGVILHYDYRLNVFDEMDGTAGVQRYAWMTIAFSAGPAVIGVVAERVDPMAYMIALAALTLTVLRLMTLLFTSAVESGIKERGGSVGRKKHWKITLAIWQLVFFFFSNCFGFVLAKESGLLLTTELADADPVWSLAAREATRAAAPHQLFFFCQLGFYLEQLFSLIRMEKKERPGDFVAMIVHHIATMTLEVTALRMLYMPIGMLIVLVHDPADLFLQAAKLHKYMGKEFQRYADFWFVMFLLAWIVMRLWMLPAFVLPGVFFSSVLQQTPITYYGSCVLLSTLQCLHVFWFYLIMKAVYKLVFGKGVSDDRSDDSGDEDDEDNDDAKKDD